MKRNRIDVLSTGLVIILCALAALAGARPAGAAETDPLDWPSWRGPEQDGISRETAIVDRWDPAAEGTSGNVLWRNAELGSIATPIVMRGKLYTIVRSDAGTPQDCEKVVCVDAATGKKIWEKKNNVFLSDVPAERIGWASCVGDPATGNIFVIGACGYFQALDGETGKTLWDHSFNEEFGLLTTYGGRLTTPVVFEDLVIAGGVIIGWGEMARPTHRLLAFDKKTGQIVWIGGTRPLPEDTTYSVPAVTTLNGQAALVFGSGDGGVYAWQPRTGKPIWNFNLSLRGLSVSPLVADDKVYIAQAEENTENANSMGAIVCLDGSGSGNITDKGEVWRAPGMVGKSSQLLIDGRLYSFDDGGKLYINDAATGKPVGKPVKLVGTIMRSSPLYADGKIYACTTSAWHVLQPTKDGVKITHKLRLSANDEVAGSPIVSHGRLYLPTTAQLYCLANADGKRAASAPSSATAPPAPKETPAGKDDKPAQVQIVPAEMLLKPGWEQKLSVKLYNARGQFLREGKADFTLAGPGKISGDGTFVAASGPAHTATIVTAKVGNIQGQARIRVVPELPWKFDFSDGEVPITWVGARYRHVVRDVDGNKVMVKITTIPKGTRSQSIMGHPDAHDYTIQADVYGALANDKLPDVGVIAQRYTMDLMGDHQEIQIRSWTSQLDRFSKKVPFKWNGNTWYTMKFQASTDGGKATLKGKVWPRGEKEPAAWTIEAVDEAGNLVGSPGLFGNATSAEAYIDNVIVTKNATQ